MSDISEIKENLSLTPYKVITASWIDKENIHIWTICIWMINTEHKIPI